MQTNVIFLPFAGGSKHAYTGFVKAAPRGLNIIPVELPGRGIRYKDDLLDDVHALTEDVFAQVKDLIKDGNYAVFGHSMGTLIGFLLTKKILAAQMPPPMHLFMSGRGGPAVIYNDGPPAYLLSKEKFIDKIRELGGSPEEILQDENMMNFFEPILRADFKAVGTYSHQPSDPFDVPVTVMLGINDKTTMEQAMLWQNETTKPLVVKKFPGKHFFLFGYEENILHIISDTINKLYNENRIVIP
ncbi:MAG: Thioesterase [Bacteroidetes bacterium]|jgi:surfactin synthase thioesterase subunit|nr:Thioesterase [Bacteroidota bacterium]